MVLFPLIYRQGQPRLREQVLQGPASSKWQNQHVNLGNAGSKLGEEGREKSEKARNKQRQTKVWSRSRPCVCLPGSTTATFVFSHISPCIRYVSHHLETTNTFLSYPSTDITTSAQDTSSSTPSTAGLPTGIWSRRRAHSASGFILC